MRLAEARIHRGDLLIQGITLGLPCVPRRPFGRGLRSNLRCIALKPGRFHFVGFGLELLKIVAWRRCRASDRDLQFSFLACTGMISVGRPTPSLAFVDQGTRRSSNRDRGVWRRIAKGPGRRWRRIDGPWNRRSAPSQGQLSRLTLAARFAVLEQQPGTDDNRQRQRNGNDPSYQPGQAYLHQSSSEVIIVCLENTQRNVHTILIGRDSSARASSSTAWSRCLWACWDAPMIEKESHE